MRLYEIDITSLWWMAAEDELEAMAFLREELYNREVSEEEMDIIMDDLTVKELPKEEAEMISVIDEFGSPSVNSLWEMFSTSREPGLLHSDFCKEEEGEEEEVSNEFGSLPLDWY